MKPDKTGVSVVNYGCDTPDCDFGGEAKNGVGLAAQHAASTGHQAWAEQVTNMWWNSTGGDS